MRFIIPLINEATEKQSSAMRPLNNERNLTVALNIRLRTSPSLAQETQRIRWDKASLIEVMRLLKQNECLLIVCKPGDNPEVLGKRNHRPLLYF